MSAFAYAIDFVLSQEGGLVDDPNDSGGITNMGISLAFANSVGFDANADGKTNASDIRGLQPTEAIALYRENFWLPIAGAQLPHVIAVCLFDTAVNMGVPAAVKLMQRQVGTTEDGVMGPKTIAAIVSKDPVSLMQQFLSERILKYTRLPKFSLYGRGWVRRVLALEKYCLTTMKEGKA